MAQSLDPLTVLLKLAHAQRNSEYNNKLMLAVNRDYGHFEWADQISTVILNTPEAQNLNVISALAELSIVAPPRNQRRVFIPLIWVSIFCMSKQEIQACSYKAQTSDQGRPVMTLPDITTEALVTKASVSILDFSGKGASIIWNTMASVFKFSYPSDTVSINKASQAVFHSYWGTFSEDFGTLNWLTGVNFLTRKEMGDFFKGKGTTETQVVLELPKMRRYCKVVSGNVTKRGSAKHGQISCHPVFAGKRKVEYKAAFFRSSREERKCRI